MRSHIQKPARPGTATGCQCDTAAGGATVKCIPTTGKVEPEGSLIDETDIVAIMEDVGDTLRHIRVAQRVQMADLAEMGNMSPDVLSRIERGTRVDRGFQQLYVTTGL